MKRLVETERWKDRWFQSLSPVTKLALSYITDHCDAAGVWEANFEVAEVQIGFTKAGMVVRWKEIFDELNRPPPLDEFMMAPPKPAAPNVMIIAPGQWWLTQFIPFQWGATLSETLPRHAAIFKSLVKHGLWETFIKLYPDSVSEAVKAKPPVRGVFPAQPRCPGNGTVLLPASVDELKNRIQAIDAEIAKLQQQTFTPEGRVQPRIQPEAMAEIKRLKAIKAEHEQQIREGGSRAGHQ